MAMVAVRSGLGVVLVAAMPAFAAEPIGSALAIRNDVTVAAPGASAPVRPLKKDDPVAQDEVIETGLSSLGELQFKDETKLAIGPGARVVLDKFVYDPSKSNGSIVLNVVKGTFRFVTGLAAKTAYEIKTPTASISVRGTVFDICVRPNGATWVLLIEGSLRMCAPGGSCRVMSEPGKVMRVTPDRKVRAATSWPDLPGKKGATLQTAFPFATLSPSFAPAPQLSGDDILNGRISRNRQKSRN